jgi:hypothetical protein
MFFDFLFFLLFFFTPERFRNFFAATFNLAKGMK